MTRATTAKGTGVIVFTTPDVEPNEGGLYCEICLEWDGDRFDDFCIHPDDCDCSDEEQVDAYIDRYVSEITDY
jgi:hypothetical protein